MRSLAAKMAAVFMVLTMSLQATQWANGYGSSCCNGCDYSPHQLWLGVDFDYQYLDPTTGESPDGALWGVAAEYNYIRNCTWYVGAEVSWVTGDLNNGIERTVHDLDISGHWGYTWFFNWCNCTGYIIPFVGLGFRDYENEFSLTNVDDPQFSYYRWYAPLGFRLGVPFCECWEIGLNFAYRFDVDTTRYLNEDNIRQKLDTGGGVLVQLPITWRWCPGRCCDWQVRAVPYWKWDKFGETALTPTNSKFDLHDWGALLQIGFRM